MRFHYVISDRKQARSFFPSLRASLLAAASVMAFAGWGAAQNPTIPTPPPTTTTTTDGSNTTTSTTTVDSTGKPIQSVTTTHTFGRGKKKDAKADKVVASKDTKKNAKKTRMADSLIGVDSKLPDKQLFDKAQVAIKKGHFDVGRLDLQTMLNTYPDSQYQMRAKLAIADSWYKEGGTAALTQAEQEYRDFCIFFPNAPEAAEAQKRIGDIYFRQMDKPDRDYSKALHAEEEYRRMITDYADSKLVPDAKQRLREVQEVLATRESDIAAYYATRQNWAAVIARYETVSDTYPLYSHMDDALIGLGDAYEAQAKYIRNMQMPRTAQSEAMRAKLEQIYDGRAADSYRKVVLEHSAAAHVEDARDRLAALNLEIPTPTKEQAAASEALENSRRNYRVTDHVRFLLMHEPDTVLTAQVGDPSLVDAKVTTAPQIVARVTADFNSVVHPEAAAPAATAPTVGEAPAPTTAQPGVPAAPLAFTEVGTGDASAPTTTTNLTATPAGSATVGGKSIGVEILNGATPATLPAATGKDDPNGGLKAVGPAHASELPPIEKAGDAPDLPNTITAATPPAAAPPANGKKAKPEFDKSDESSSKHKKKKGIKKIIPPNPL